MSLRIGTPVKIIADVDLDDPHSCDGEEGIIYASFDATPGNEKSPMWREQGGKCYTVEFADRTQQHFWPEELERVS